MRGRGLSGKEEAATVGKIEITGLIRSATGGDKVTYGQANTSGAGDAFLEHPPA